MGFQIEQNVTASLSGLTIDGGSLSGPGGGLANYGGTANLTDCTISGNSAVNGGGLYTNNYGTTNLTDCTISDNSASAYGGGVFNSVGSSTTSNLTDSAHQRELRRQRRGTVRLRRYDQPDELRLSAAIPPI